MSKILLPQREQEIKTPRFLPQDAGLEPLHPISLPIDSRVNISLVNLFGQTSDGGKLVSATPWNTLLVTSYGSGYTTYAVKADTAPSSYSTSHALILTGGYFHRFDILIESQEALIRCYNDRTSQWGGDIPLTVGNHSMEITTSSIQIKKRGSTAGTYTLVGYY